MKKLLLLSLLFIAGCTPYTKRQKIAMTTFVASSITDVLSTRQVLQSGGIECNPMYGKHPSDLRLNLTKIIQFTIIYTMGEINPEGREVYWYVGAGVSTYATIHNINEK